MLGSRYGPVKFPIKFLSIHYYHICSDISLDNFPDSGDSVPKTP